MVARVAPVATYRAVNVTPGSDAPVSSRIVPNTLAVAICAAAFAALPSASTVSHAAVNNAQGLIVPLSIGTLLR